MDQQDYFAPARYEPPPRRSPWAVLRWVLLALAMVGLAFGIWYGIQRLLIGTMQSQIESVLPAAGVRIGEPLSWRELERRPLATLMSTGTMGGLYVGDFDGEGDEELLVISLRGKSQIYEADGTKQPVAISGMSYMMDGISWDYDRDGVAEITVPTMLGDVRRGARQGRTAEEMFVSQDLPVYDLSGLEVARLAAVASMPRSVKVADVDGDGWPELLACKPDPQRKYGSDTLLAFGERGEKVWQLRRTDTTFAVCGDVDGDGMDEYVNVDDGMRALVAEGLDQDRVTLHRWSTSTQPVACADLNGDAWDEVIVCSPVSDHILSYLDCSTNQVVDLPIPPAAQEVWVAVSTEAVAGEYLHAGSVAIAASTLSCGALLLFDPLGSCTYYEEFGEMIWGIRTLRSGGQDYLVVQLTERVLIYP